MIPASDIVDINGHCLETRRIHELRPHPGLMRLGLPPAVFKLSALAERGEAAFADPLTVTHEGYILDGYARWEVAKRQARSEVPCLVRTLSKEDALIQLLRAQHRSSRLNDFNRIRLALDLEPYLKLQARGNQSTAGRREPSSEMTKAQRLDVRAEIARIAGVATGNVSNTKFLLENAAPDVITGLAVGKIRIGRASKWLKISKDRGQRELRDFQMKRAMQATSKALLSHRPTLRPASPEDEFSPVCELASEQQQSLLRHLLATLPEPFVRQTLIQAGLGHAV